MTTADKLVFISYRRSTSKAYARLIFDRLRAAGYDAFLDVSSIDSGAFDSVILSQIAARPHFILLISPGALERCQNEGDWLRREIQEAMRLGRNIVPLIEEEVELTKETNYLPEHLRADFRRYNGIPLIHFYFDSAMDTLTNRFLKKPVHGIRLAIPSLIEQKEVEKRIEAIAASPAPTQEQLTAEQYFNRAYKKDEDEDIDGAIEDYSEAIHLNPQHASAYNNRGLARKGRGDLDGAIADYTVAIHIEPNAIRYNNRGLARKGRGDLDGAIADYTVAIRFNSNDSDIYNNRGLARKDKGDLDGAIADYNQAIRLNPQNAKAYLNRGNVFFYRNIDLAIADYNQAIYLDPQNAKAYLDRGNAFFYRNIDLAIADYNQAIYLDPQNAEAYLKRGNALCYRNIDLAIADYSEAIRLNSQEPLAYLQRGIARRPWNIDLAINDFMEAIRCKPDYAHAYACLGDCYYSRQQYIDALRNYEYSLSLPIGNEDRLVIYKNTQALRQILGR